MSYAQLGDQIIVEFANDQSASFEVIGASSIRVLDPNQRSNVRLRLIQSNNERFKLKNDQDPVFEPEFELTGAVLRGTSIQLHTVIQDSPIQLRLMGDGASVKNIVFTEDIKTVQIKRKKDGSEDPTEVMPEELIFKPVESKEGSLFARFDALFDKITDVCFPNSEVGTNPEEDSDFFGNPNYVTSKEVRGFRSSKIKIHRRGKKYDNSGQAFQLDFDALSSKYAQKLSITRITSSGETIYKIVVMDPISIYSPGLEYGYILSNDDNDGSMYILRMKTLLGNDFPIHAPHIIVSHDGMPKIDVYDTTFFQDDIEEEQKFKGGLRQLKASIEAGNVHVRYKAKSLEVPRYFDIDAFEGSVQTLILDYLDELNKPRFNN